MFLDVVYSYYALVEYAPNVAPYALVCFGSIVGIATTRSEKRLSRSWYFALLGLTLLATSVTSLILVGSGHSFMGGAWIYFVLASDLIFPFIAGLLIGFWSFERSMDAFGSRWSAVIVIVPIAALTLLIKKGEEPGNRHRFAWDKTGLGVFVGILAFATSQALPLEIMPSNFGEKVEEAYISDPALYAEVVVRNEKLPYPIQPGVTLVSAEADGLTMTYIYEVLPAVHERLDTSAVGPEDTRCVDPTNVDILSRGISIRDIYRSTVGAEFTIDISPTVCGISI